jgi:outer membrane protein assembly factor BamB
MSDGATIWKFDTAANTSQQSEFFSTPAIAPASSGDDLVIAGTGAGTVYAFSVADGSLVWSFETGSVVKGMNGGTGRAPVTGSVVLAPHSGQAKPETGYVGAWDGCVYAFDTMSGKHKWKYQAMDKDSGTKAQVRATPAVSVDGTVVHFPAGRALYALDAATGMRMA